MTNRELILVLSCNLLERDRIYDALYSSHYGIVMCVNGKAALEQYQPGTDFALVIVDDAVSDIVINELVSQIQIVNKKQHLLIISEDTTTGHQFERTGLKVLYRPFTPRAFLDTIQEILE